MRGRADSAGDVDYDVAGVGYATVRQPDPRIAAQFHAALGAAHMVLNVGAGAGSYEPVDRAVIAVEPAAAMRSQRPAHLGPVIGAAAEALPFAKGAFAAAMASFTVHQWRDLPGGLAELRRVTDGPIVILTADPAVLQTYWLGDYAPELMAAEAGRMPEIDRILDGLGGGRVEVVPVPLDCTDGFAMAYYGRPESLLDPAVRRAQSAWTFLDPAVHERSVARLAASLAEGSWDAAYGELRSTAQLDLGIRLVVAEA